MYIITMIIYMPDFSTLHRCNHCGHEWYSQKIGAKPRVCPVRSCQSERWDKPTRKAPPITQVRSLEHLKELVTITETGCWEWNHGRTSHGYGVGVLNGRQVMIHRMIWYLRDGAYPPPHDFICHTCDNPPCCNPDHLFMGTQSDNMRDCVDKGRHTQHEAKYCKQGHLRELGNMYTSTGKNGRTHYHCKTCHNRIVAAYKRKRAAGKEVTSCA
jgi:hypothetical protein